MSEQSVKINSNSILFFLLTIFLSVLFLNASGTSDMHIWEDWIKQINMYGFVRGFAAIDDVQPPLCSIFLSIVSHIARVLNLPELYSIKLSVTLFLLASTIIILIWTKNFVIAGLFQLLLTLNVGLGYLDIYYTPFLLGAFIALEREKFDLALFCYAISALVKSQPLLLAPFTLLYIWFRRPTTGIYQQIQWYAKNFIPTLFIIIPIIVIYNKTLIRFLVNAKNGTFISGNALNLGWILTYFIKVFHLYNQQLDDWGLNNYIGVIPIISLFLKGLFFIAYGFTFYRFCTSVPKTFNDLLKYMSAAFFSYFALNSSVHENHLFILMVICVLLYHKALITNLELCLTAIFGNLNLILFYGLNGTGLPFDRGIFPIIDISIIFSFLLLWFFTVYFCRINRIGIHSFYLSFMSRYQRRG